MSDPTQQKATTMRTLIRGLTAALLIAGGATAMSGTASAATEHCPDHNGHPNKVQVGESGFDIYVSGNAVTFPSGTVFCVKSATEASGKVTSDGSPFILNRHDVSYFIVYSAPGYEPPVTTTPPVTTDPPTETTDPPVTTDPPIETTIPEVEISTPPITGPATPGSPATPITQPWVPLVSVCPDGWYPIDYDAAIARDPARCVDHDPCSSTGNTTLWTLQPCPTPEEAPQSPEITPMGELPSTGGETGLALLAASLLGSGVLIRLGARRRIA